MDELSEEDKLTVSRARRSNVSYLNHSRSQKSLLENMITCQKSHSTWSVIYQRSCKRQNDWPLKHHKIQFERLKLLVLQISKSIQFLHYVNIQTCKNRNGYNCQFFRQLKFSNAFTETNSKTLIA